MNSPATSRGRLRALPVHAGRGDTGGKIRRFDRFRAARRLSPQITIDAPVQIPEDYVPDLDLRMGPYRRLNDPLEDARAMEAFAVELRDRPPVAAAGNAEFADANPHQAELRKGWDRAAGCRRERRWSRSTRIASGTGRPYRLCAQRLQGTAKLRPDNKLVISRAWKDGPARLHAGLQLSTGLAKVAG